MMVAAMAMKLPMMAQKGTTIATAMMPRSITTPVGVAGRMLSVSVVVSTKGWGMR